MAQLVDQLRRARFTHLGDAIENLSAVVRGLSAPAGERLARRLHGVAQIFSRAAARVCQQFASLAFHGIETPRLGARELAVDVELVGFSNVESRHGVS